MDKQEYQAWARFQMKNAGHWVIDPIHDGVARDLVAYVTNPKAMETGIYVAVDKSGSWHTGRFEQGCVRGPCEGIMIPARQGKCDSYDAAIKHLTETLGLTFLLALTHGVSPYRVM